MPHKAWHLHFKSYKVINITVNGTKMRPKMALQWKLEIFSAWTRKQHENHIQDKKTISNTSQTHPKI